MKTQTAINEKFFIEDKLVDFKEAFEHSAIGTAVVSLEGRWIEVNNAVCKIVGYSRNELLKTDFQTITHPDDLDKDLNLLNKLLKNEINSYEMEKRYFHKNGEVIWVQLNVSLARDNDSNPLYFVSQIQDISEKKNIGKELSKSHEEQSLLNKKLQESHNKMEGKVIERTKNLQKVIDALSHEVKTHKKTQNELRKSQKKYQDLYNYAPDMYASIDPNTATVIECNNTLAKAIGYEKDEIIGMKIFDLYHPDCHVDVKEAFNQFVLNGEVKNKELQLKRKDGSRIDVSLNVGSVRDEKGNIIRSRSSWRDISQQKILERKLQHTIDKLSKKNSYEKIISNVTQSIHNSIDIQLVLDNTVESLTLNIPTLSSASVYIINNEIASLKAQKGLPDWFIEEAGNIPYPKGFTWQAIVENKIICCQDIDKDNTIGPAGRNLGTMSYIALPINVDCETVGVLNLHSHNKNNFSDEFIFILQTIVSQIEVAFSNAKKAEQLSISQKKLKNINESLENKVKKRTLELEKFTEELQLSNKELEQFAYVASHDLQEPLRKVKSFTELLSKKYEGHFDEKGDKYIEYIVDGATRMQNLILDLLSYSRVGKEKDSKSQVDLNLTLKKVLDSLSLKITETKTEIINEKLPEIYSNENDIFRILLNLINNAIKFRKKETDCVIKIRSEENKNEYEISVTDNGIGIDQEYIQKIFGIFERLHSKTEYQGTGIGLAICKKIVEKNGGRIWAESKKGEGTKFSFTVPKEKGNVHKTG